MTTTVIVQVPPAARLPPFKPTLLLPAAPPVIVPPQVLLSAGVEAITNPEGKVSIKVAPVKEVAVELFSVKVRVEVPLGAIGLVEKDLLMVGEPTLLAMVVVLFVRLESKVVLEAVAVLLTLFGAVASTLTVIVMSGKLAPFTRLAVLFVQVTTCKTALQLQLVPVPET